MLTIALWIIAIALLPIAAGVAIEILRIVGPWVVIAALIVAGVLAVVFVPRAIISVLTEMRLSELIGFAVAFAPLIFFVTYKSWVSAAEKGQ